MPVFVPIDIQKQSPISSKHQAKAYNPYLLGIFFVGKIKFGGY